MLILGIETSAKACSAALCRDGELLAQSYERTGLTHSRTLLPMIENMLSNTETPKDAIDMVAVAQGPGSFTGIRIGISTAKGLCWGLDIPAVGVSTLEAMAQSARFVPEGTIVCPAMDARRSQLYNALFTVQNGALVRLTEDRAIAADALAEELSGSGKSVWVLGDGWAICEKALPSTANAILKYLSARSIKGIGPVIAALSAPWPPRSFAGRRRSACVSRRRAKPRPERKTCCRFIFVFPRQNASGRAA